MSVVFSVRVSSRGDGFVWIVRYLTSDGPLLASYETFSDADSALDFAMGLRDRGVQVEVVASPLSQTGQPSPLADVLARLES